MQELKNHLSNIIIQTSKKKNLYIIIILWVYYNGKPLVQYYIDVNGDVVIFCLLPNGKHDTIDSLLYNFAISER